MVQHIHFKKSEIVEAMAWTKEAWVDRLSNMIAGALGEYAKQKYADLVGFKNYSWTPEVNRLIKEIERHIKDTKTKTKFKREEAVKEAIKRAFLNQLKVTQARNKFMDMSDKYANKIGDISYSADILILEMLREGLPKTVKISYPDPFNE